MFGIKKYHFIQIILSLSCMIILLCIGNIWTGVAAQAKEIKGSCGKEAQFCYSEKEHRLDIFGKGAVTKQICVYPNKKNQCFAVQKLVIHKGITTLQNAMVLEYARMGRTLSEHKENYYRLYAGMSMLPGATLCVELPEGFQKITCNMFGKLDITELHIPVSVSKIESGAFWGQKLLKKIIVHHENKVYASRDGVLYSRSYRTLFCYPCEKTDRKFVVPDSVQSIAPMAFRANGYLRNVKLPKKLKCLGAGSFFGCRRLKKINIAQLVKLKRIQDYKNVKRVRMGKVMIHAEDKGYYDDYANGREADLEDVPYQDTYGTFSGTSLECFEMPEHLQYIASESFHYCDKLHRFFIGRKYKGKINMGQECSQKSLFLYYADIRQMKVHPDNQQYVLWKNVLYTKDKKTICQIVHDKTYKKKTLQIAKSVTQIADGAFYCSNLYENIVLSGKIKYIGRSAFAASTIRSFTGKNKIERIEKGAFLCCFYLKHWKCDKGVGVYAENAFDFSSSASVSLEAGGIFQIFNRLWENINMHTISWEALIEALLLG